MLTDTERGGLVGKVAVVLQRVKTVKLGESLEPIAEEIIDLVLSDRGTAARALKEYHDLQDRGQGERASILLYGAAIALDTTIADLLRPESLASDDRICEIVVNGKTLDIPVDVVEYHDVVALAFPQLPSFTSVPFTITYRNARNPKEGTLRKGQAVVVAERGTVFNVVVIS